LYLKYGVYWFNNVDMLHDHVCNSFHTYTT